MAGGGGKPDDNQNFWPSGRPAGSFIHYIYIYAYSAVQPNAVDEISPTSRTRLYSTTTGRVWKGWRVGGPLMIYGLATNPNNFSKVFPTTVRLTRQQQFWSTSSHTHTTRACFFERVWQWTTCGGRSTYLRTSDMYYYTAATAGHNGLRDRFLKLSRLYTHIIVYGYLIFNVIPYKLLLTAISWNVYLYRYYICFNSSTAQASCSEIIIYIYSRGSRGLLITWRK